MYSVGLDVDKFVFTVKILLYAENFSISGPLILIMLGKIYYKQNYLLEQSAGNFSFIKKITINTNNTSSCYTKLNIISEHIGKHRSSLTDEEFGYFLAGLIEGNGLFGEKQLSIFFAESDISLAYYIKKRTGFGKVSKHKSNKAVSYLCDNTAGLLYILFLINGKLVSKPKYEQLLLTNYATKYKCKILPPSNCITLDNHWLAGFIQTNGCFYITISKNKTHKTDFDVKLEFSIKHNNVLPLELIYHVFKTGFIYQYNTSLWYYKSSELKTAELFINYFDEFNVFAGKYVSFLKFRKVYIMITNGKHLEKKGITRIKSIATKGSSETSTQEIF